MRRAPLALMVPLSLLLASISAKAAPTADPLVVVPGSLARMPAHAQKLGSIASNQPMSIAVSLGLRNVGALRSFIDTVSDPRSPLHGRYLTPREFADRFGPAPATVSQLTDYLRGQGLTVQSDSSKPTVIDASGPAAAVERAFGTPISRWRDGGQAPVFFANDSEPSLPASLAAAVVGVAGLNDHSRAHHHAVAVTQTCPTNGPPSTAVCPAQATTAYALNSLAAAGHTGTGQNVGLFELDGFQQTDLNGYNNEYGLPALAPTVHLIDGATGIPTTTGGQTEVDLDIELAHAYAPGAHITVWEGPSTGTDQAVIDTYNDIVARDETAVNSTSWGLCEPDSTPSLMTALDAVFMQAAAQGMTFFAASGDTGKYDCASDPTSPNATRVSVDNPADDPYVTAAGGTSLTTNPDFTYNGETAWGDTTSGHGGGGGVSAVFRQPGWQTGTIAQQGTAWRQVPDVSLDSDPNTGYAIFAWSPQNSKSQWLQVAGTSAAAPAWAAFAAVFNQDAGAQSKPPLGFANPALYRIAGVPNTAFHDVTTGTNKISTGPPYTAFDSAAAGWDYATGWGSFDASNLATAILATPPPQPTLTGLNPTSGPTSGGTAVSITGTNFSFSGYGTTVRKVGFGTSDVTAPCNRSSTPPPNAPCFTVVSASSITVYSPGHSPGAVGVTVSTDAGTTAASTFTYFGPPPQAPQGYWLVASDGGIFPFGRAAGFGSTGGIHLNKPIIGMAATPDHGGYWLVASDGGIFPFGDAGGFGSTGGIHLNQPIVGMAPSRSGRGYWLVASDGGIFPFGDAVGYGSTGGIHLNKPIVGMAPSATGNGYYLVASDGGIFPFGDAIGYGSTGGIHLNQPIVGMATDPHGGGYWLVASDGGIFPFGGARGFGSTGGIHLNKPIVGMASDASGNGYWLVASDGGIFPFGDAQGLGSTGGIHLNQPIVGMAAFR